MIIKLKNIMIKKLFLFIAIALMMAMPLHAQTVEGTTPLDNTYIGISTGLNGWFNPSKTPIFLHHQDANLEDVADGLTSVTTLRLGKYFTPVVGLEATIEMGLGRSNKFNGQEFKRDISVDHTMIGLNLMFNLNNVFHKYCGNPDRFEVVPFIGGGWHRTYGTVGNRHNNIAMHIGSYFNVNIGQKRAFQFNIIPLFGFIPTDHGSNTANLSAMRNKTYFNIQLGFTYKFKNKQGSHNFVLAPTNSDLRSLQNELNTYRLDLEVANETNSSLQSSLEQANKDKDALANENRTLRERHKENEEILMRKINERQVCVTPSLGFKRGKSKLDETSEGWLESVAEAAIANNKDIVIKGYADANTGTEDYNLKLSARRAETVKKELVKLGVDKNRITTVPMGDTEQPFSNNDSNRTVIVLFK